MFDATVEQLVKVKAPKISILYKTVLIIACVLAATTIPQTGIIGTVLMVVFIVFTFFVFQYYNAEYEYTLVEDSLSIDRVMGKQYRRRGGTYDIGRATLISNVNSNDALRMARANLKTFNYSSGVDDPGDMVIYTYDSESNEQIRLFLLPDEKMKSAIKEAAPASAWKVEDDKNNN